jgi:hypothetical protein
MIYAPYLTHVAGHWYRKIAEKPDRDLESFFGLHTCFYNRYSRFDCDRKLPSISHAYEIRHSVLLTGLGSRPRINA